MPPRDPIAADGTDEAPPCLSVAIAAPRGDHRLDVAFDATLVGTTILFGPSGAGKSSVLEAVAGLWRPDVATIRLGAQVLQDGRAFVPPERRGFGLVQQDSLLFPHLSVAANLRYGARRAGARPSIGLDLAGVVELLGIEALLDRRPATLSGGQRQRVAIGRALLARPRMLLMDEPLASLDQERRSEILSCLRRLRTRVGLPILYVTHALDEVAALADTLVLMAEDGRVLASGPAGALATSVALPLARRDDAFSLLETTIARHDPARGLTELDGGGGGAWLVPLHPGRPGERRRIRIPAREVALATELPRAISLNNALPARVQAIGAVSAHQAVVGLVLEPGGQALIARVTSDAVRRLSLAPGRKALALVKSTSIEVLPWSADPGLDPPRPC